MPKYLVAALVLAIASAPVSAGSGLAQPSSASRVDAGGSGASDFVADVVGPYLTIQTALVNDDLAPVTTAAGDLQKGAGALGADGKALAAAATATARATTLEAARAAFADLSAALIAYADKTKQPVEGKIVAFCPMAKKSWVQTEGAVANPYYGKAMASCGSATRKLSPTQ